MTACTGSPPQVRGKPRPERLSRRWYRITPAGAGKTALLQQNTNAVQDHPRRCGENRTAPKNAAERLGSPPQVRGKPAVATATVVAVRITPAGAGKTLSSCP